MIKKSNEFCVLEKFLKVSSEFEKEFVEEIAEEKKEYVRRKKCLRTKIKTPANWQRLLLISAIIIEG